MMVHVIGKYRGQRFQFDFKDGTSDDAVLRAVKSEGGRLRCGRAEWVEKVDPITGMKTLFADRDGPWLVDAPDTVIAIGHADEHDEFVEDKRLSGPPADETKTYVPMQR